MSVNNRIKELRKNYLNLTQVEFGNRIGAAGSTVVGWEKGNRIPGDTTIKMICKEFHVNYMWLKEGEGEVFSTVEKSLIDRLTDEYELNPVQRRIIEQVITLSDDEINCFTEKFFGFKAVEKEQFSLLF